VGDFFVHLSLLFISSVFDQESDLGNLYSDGHVSKVLIVKSKTGLITCDSYCAVMVVFIGSLH
jgi:hypothetical protein